MDTTRTMTVPRKTKPDNQSERIDLRVSAAFLARLEEAAARKGISVSAYLRMSASEKMDADAVPQPTKPRPRG